MRKIITLPYRHYYYLNFLRLLRRESIQEAIEYLYENLDENPDNWIDARFAHFNKPDVDVDITNVKANVNEISLLRRIQALPPGIKPITDGPYSLDVKFEEEQNYIVMHLLGYKIYDFKKSSEHGGFEYRLFTYRLIKDKFPFEMTLNQYDVYCRVGAQFWRLIQDREQETMPLNAEVAMDVGAYVGLRALAMHYCVGAKGFVYAIEVEDENFRLLKKNIEENNLSNMLAIQEGIDSTSRIATLYTRNKQSMAHGLRSFESIEDPGAIATKNLNRVTCQVQTLTMDDLFKKYNIEKVDNMHISVTGHEVEVLNGINSILPVMKKVRVSCPYKTDGIPNIETARKILEQKGFINFKNHGAAIIGER